MSFQTIQIRYQTARSLPAPYAYFYTLTLHSTGNSGVRVDLAITYPDRDDIDDDELIAEGYTRDDDFSWQGNLPDTWLKALENLVDGTRLTSLDEESLSEDDDFWDVTIEQARPGQAQPGQATPGRAASGRGTPSQNGVKSNGVSPNRGRPAHPDEWQYTVQELIQAAYEQIGREHPFTMTYLSIDNRNDETELRLTGSFAKRSISLVSLKNRQERSRTLPWSAMQHLMQVIYSHDYVSEDALLKRPRREGKWLNLGSEEWYEITHLSDLVQALRGMQ